MPVTAPVELLPDLPYPPWEATKQTLHRYTQIVGKVRLAATNPKNHWWNAPLYLGPRGLTTGRMRVADTTFDIEFDLLTHRLVMRDDRGRTEEFALHDGLSVAEFHARVMAALERLGIPVTIVAVPFGIGDDTPFADDEVHASYQPEAVTRFWRVLSWAEWVLDEFAGWYCGKSSPVHLFWHSFDLALTRFSGARADPRPGVDTVTAEAYSHEVISFGFWPGDATVREPTFYSYTAPEPPGLTGQALVPSAASWQNGPTGSLAVLPYEQVRTAASPRNTLLAFLESAYQAGAGAAGWNRADLTSRWCPPSPQVLARPR